MNELALHYELGFGLASFTQGLLDDMVNAWWDGTGSAPSHIMERRGDFLASVDNEDIVVEYGQGRAYYSWERITDPSVFSTRIVYSYDVSGASLLKKKYTPSKAHLDLAKGKDV